MSAPGIFAPPAPVNEPVKGYEPGTPERAALTARLRELESERIRIPLVIGGKDVYTEESFEAVMPHRKSHVLADVSKGGPEHVEQAIAAARAAHDEWSCLPWHERAAVFLRAAELLSGPWRATLNAATMLNQSKTVHQAEIDAVCEMVDFWRFNAEYVVRIYSEQPYSPTGIWNRMEYRPLEGFVLAVSPFNFTCIGGNLSSSPALMGNTILWKPASTAALSAYYLMRIMQAAGLPDGVINLVYGSGATIGDAALASPELAGIHFTGSTDDSEGFFVQPTVIATEDPGFRLLRDELFGPIVTTYVYDERRWDDTLRLVDETAPYALTGAVFATERSAIDDAGDKLRYSAGNFYVNDKPTGAVVGQQPFGGSRASGTNDKAGSMWNLIRWVSPRTVKETFLPPTDYRYPFLASDGSGK